MRHLECKGRLGLLHREEEMRLRDLIERPGMASGGVKSLCVLVEYFPCFFMLSFWLKELIFAFACLRNSGSCVEVANVFC